MNFNIAFPEALQCHLLIQWLIDAQREEGLEASVLTQHSSSFKNTNVILDLQLVHLVYWSPRAWQPVRVSDYRCPSTTRPRC